MRYLLRDIAEIGAGQGAPQGDSSYCDDGVPFVKAGNLQDLTAGGQITEIQKVSDEIAKAHKLRLYSKGTVLFAKSGMSCLKGYVYVLPVDAYVVSHLACITPREDISEYLRLYFTFHKPNQLVKDAAYPSISLTDIGNLEIDTKDDQTRGHIISIFRSVENIIKLRKQELQKLDDLIKARFVEMFGGISEEETLLNLCNIIDYRGKTPEKVDAGLPFITAKNVRMHHLSLEPREYISKETYDKVMTRGFPKEGDVVFTTEAPLGNVCHIPHFDTEFYIGQRIVTLQTERLIPTYLEYALDTEDFRRKLSEKSSGSTVTGIRVRLLEQLTIPVPPKKQQESFAAFVTQVEKSKIAVQKALDETQTLFDSLMQKYFE